MAYSPSSDEEAAFLKAYDPSKYPVTVVTVDVVVVKRSERGDQVLLIERGNWPYKGKLALPGGFIDQSETIRDAAARELLEETGVDLSGDTSRLFNLGVADRPDRDPRGRAISHVFYALVDSDVVATAGDDAASADWHWLDEVKDLAFDHDEWIEQVRNFLSFEKIELPAPLLYEETVAERGFDPAISTPTEVA